MNILLIALHYHGYTLNIAEERRAFGHQVKCTTSCRAL